jgi:hypothetical protein
MLGKISHLIYANAAHAIEASRISTLHWNGVDGTRRAEELMGMEKDRGGG